MQRVAIQPGTQGGARLRRHRAPPFPLMPEQASLFRSDVPRLDSPLKGRSLWDLALITSGLARSSLF